MRLISCKPFVGHVIQAAAFMLLYFTVLLYWPCNDSEKEGKAKEYCIEPRLTGEAGV